MNQRTLGRRAYLKETAIGAIAVGSGLGLLACGGKKELTCNDTAGLGQPEVAQRNALGYVDKSPNPQKLCSGCQFFQAPAKADTCGGCQLLKGPINAAGYCNSWVQKKA